MGDNNLHGYFIRRPMSPHTRIFAELSRGDMQKGVLLTETPKITAFPDRKFRKKVSFLAVFYMKKAVILISFIMFLYNRKAGSVGWLPAATLIVPIWQNRE